jgi:IAA-amino acid hydrolase
MDALPIQEPSGLAAATGGWASRTPGYMHACGHDAHMAMLLGAARLLKAREANLQGRVLLVFQPAEEGFGGARAVLQEGHLQGVAAISGVHVWPAHRSGVITTKACVYACARLSSNTVNHNL